MSDAPAPSPPPDSAAVPVPDVAAVPPRADLVAAADEPERDLAWALAHPGQALRSVPLRLWVCGSILAAAALQILKGDAELVDQSWVLWVVWFVNMVWRGAAEIRAPDLLERGEERWVEMDQPPIRPFFRVLAAALGLLLALISLSAALDIIREGDWDMLLTFLTTGAMGGVFLYMAVMGGKKGHVLLPPVPHPAYLQQAAAPAAPAALEAGDAPYADIPVEARERVPAPRDV